MEVAFDQVGPYVVINGASEFDRSPYMIERMAKIFGGFTVPNRRFKARGYLRVKVVGKVCSVENRLVWVEELFTLNGGEELEHFVYRMMDLWFGNPTLP